MRLIFLLGLGTVAGCLALSTPALAAKPDPADYPLRVHILKDTAQSRHARESKNLSDTPDYIDGMGAADLFERGVPQGFTFSYSCVDGLKASSGYGTYPARWKKNEKTLEVLVPQPGKPWNVETCSLKAELRPGLVFYWKNGILAEESAGLLKDWMVKHQYDPEKERVDPIMAPGESDDTDSPLVDPN
ncbi:MAG: hypothetical protein ABR987_23035 [Terracidiphilus sp.]|jgi:hypothetical protein